MATSKGETVRLIKNADEVDEDKTPFSYKRFSELVIEKAYCYDLPLTIFELTRSDSDHLRYAAIACGFALYAGFMILLYTMMDFSAFMKAWGVKFEISDSKNIQAKIGVVVVKILFDIGSAMKSAHSSMKEAKKHDDLMEVLQCMKSDIDKKKPIPTDTLATYYDKVSSLINPQSDAAESKQASLNNRANQLNPNHHSYYSSRGISDSSQKTAIDIRANEMNPNHPSYKSNQ